MGRDLNEFRLFVSKAQTVSAQFEFNRIPEGRATNDLDGRAVAKAHFQKPSPNIRVPADGGNRSMTPDPKRVQRTRLRHTRVNTPGKITRFLHDEPFILVFVEIVSQRKQFTILIEDF